MDAYNNSPSTTGPLRGGRQSLPPISATGPQHVMSSYPSSTLQYYYPSSNHAANLAHISTSQAHVPVLENFTHAPLPSASQSHIPSVRRTPTVSPTHNIQTSHIPNPPFFDQRIHINSPISERIQSLSPIAFHQAQPLPAFAAPQPIPLPANPILPPHAPLPRNPAARAAPDPMHQLSFVTSSLPSTKDVPLLTGKHDWGLWHSAVRTLILNANLLRHIADDPLPGATFDPGLWPTYPPIVHQRSSHADLQSFTEWWTRDGLASHILTS